MFKPKFKNHFHVEVLEPDNVFLLSEGGYLVLNGTLYAQLAPLLTGEHAVEDIIKSFDGKVPFMQVQFAISRLRQRGYIVNADTSLPDEHAAFWEGLNIEVTQVKECLQTRSVSIETIGRVSADPLLDELDKLGVQVSEGADLRVVLVDDYLQVGLDEINQQMLQTGKPWLLVKPTGMIMWMGPIFEPGQTACWACLENRVRGNRELDTFLQYKNNVQTPFPVSRANLPATQAIAYSMTALEIAKWLVLPNYSNLRNTLMTLDTSTMQTQRHTLVQRPQCPVCGTVPSTNVEDQTPPVLTSRKKRFTTDGGHRELTPEETYERYEHHISPVTGIISNLHLRLEEKNLIYIYGSAHNLAMKHTNWQVLRNSLFLRSAGKGKSRIQARASAIGESLERYSAVYQGNEPRKPGTYLDFAHAAPHPTTYLQFSEKQYVDRHYWLKKGYRRHMVPNRFEDTRVTDWTPVWSLTENTFKYVPTAYCFYGYWEPNDHSAFCWSDSNGAAAGNNPEEAILQGFLEAIERDCIAMWWYNRVQRPGVDMSSFNDPYFEAAQNYYREVGYNLWMLDLRNDLGITTLGAFAANQEGGKILVGFGAHLDPRIAASRAITEVNEMLGAVHLNSGPGDEDRLKDNEIGHWLKNATLETERYLLPDPNQPVRTLQDLESLYTDDLRDDVQVCVDIMQRHGMETLILNQTRPDIGMSVYKVIVPGLRHFWARFSPGRLYDVPVKLGWLDQPTPEEDLNPIPMFF